MSQPSYSDMGKSCRDFFSKGYYVNIFKVSAKNRGGGLETTATGTHNMEDKSVVGEVEVKGSGPFGINMIGKWDTDNLLTKKLEVQDKLVQGLKIGLEGQYNLDSGAKLAKLNTQYKIDRATIDLGVEGGDEANLLVNGAIVLGYRSFLTGYQVAYDTNDGSLKKNNVSLGYVGNGMIINASMENADLIDAHGIYRVNDSLETGIQATYSSSDDSASKFGAGVKYSLNPCTAVRAKIDSKLLLALGYEVKMTQGAAFTFCTQIDASSFSGGGSKVGFALEFGQ